MPPANPLVSIITPAYRAEDTIVRAVRSVVAQTYPRWEMLIVSDDGIDYQSLLAEHGITDPRLRIFTTGRVGGGPNLTRNIALEAAAGDFIAPLDADDLFYPKRLEVLLPLAEQQGMSGDNLAIVDLTDREPVRNLLPEGAGMNWLDMANYALTSTPLIFLFRQDLIEMSWDEDIELGADTLFNLRVMERVQQVPFVTQVLHEYHVLPDSICHAPDAPARAEQAYHHCLQQLDATGLGFRTQWGILVVKEMLLRKREINRRYTKALKAGLCRNFQQYIADGSDRQPWNMDPSAAMIG